MKMIISGVEYVSAPEIELSACNGCTFFNNYCSIERTNEVFVETAAGPLCYSSRICSSNKIIWMNKDKLVTNIYDDSAPEQTYTESQIIQALENRTSVNVELFMLDLKKFADPEYAEYIRLHEKFGSVN